MEALRALAEIHAAHRLAPAGYAGPNAGLRLLDEALGVVEAIGGHHEKSELYTEIARAHERAGDVQGALRAERAARAEERNEQNRRAANQLLLARERNETERQRIEAEWQRSIAQAESRNGARTLEVALDTLEQLRLVGQDITAHLDPGAMLEAIDGHLRRLADVSFIGVLCVPRFRKAKKLTRCTRSSAGDRFPCRDIALERTSNPTARGPRAKFSPRKSTSRPTSPAIPGHAHSGHGPQAKPLVSARCTLHDELLGGPHGAIVVAGRIRRTREARCSGPCAATWRVTFGQRAHPWRAWRRSTASCSKTEADMRRLATTDPRR